MKISDVLLVADLIESNPNLLKVMRIFHRIDSSVVMVENEVCQGWNFELVNDDNMSDSDFDDLHDLGCVFMRNNKVGKIVWFCGIPTK